MRLIISPAKKMNVTPDILEFQGYPEFLEDTDQLRRYVSGLSYGEAKELWKCNDSIAEQNFERFKDMDLRRNLTPAIMAYEGIQYQYMAPAVFENQMLAYVQEHLRILSGFYGVLKPLDGVTPYRLEMQAKAAIGGCKDLYELWGDRIYREVRDEDGVIINLASKEYSRCVEKYLTAKDTLITCIFAERVKGKLVQKSTYAKMARGEMVRFLAERKVEDPREMKKFDRLGFVYREKLSSDTKYVFERMYQTGAE